MRPGPTFPHGSLILLFAGTFLSASLALASITFPDADLSSRISFTAFASRCYRVNWGEVDSNYVRTHYPSAGRVFPQDLYLTRRLDRRESTRGGRWLSIELSNPAIDSADIFGSLQTARWRQQGASAIAVRIESFPMSVGFEIPESASRAKTKATIAWDTPGQQHAAIDVLRVSCAGRNDFLASHSER